MFAIRKYDTQMWKAKEAERVQIKRERNKKNLVDLKIFFSLLFLLILLSLSSTAFLSFVFHFSHEFSFYFFPNFLFLFSWIEQVIYRFQLNTVNHFRHCDLMFLFRVLSSLFISTSFSIQFSFVARRSWIRNATAI